MAQADTEFRGKVRTRDPQTSWDAAERQTRTRTQQVQAEVLDVLHQFGSLTDDEIFVKREKLRKAHMKLNDPHPAVFPQASPQSVRSRRSELVTLGFVRATDNKRPSNLGGPSTVRAVVLNG